MGLFSFITKVCLIALVALEGVNTDLIVQGEKNAAVLLGYLATHFGLNVKSLIAFIPFLRFLAIGSLGALLGSIFNLLPVVYLLFTRANLIQTKTSSILSSITSKGPLEGANASIGDITYVLSSVATIAFFASNIFSCCSKTKCAVDKSKAKHK